MPIGRNQKGIFPIITETKSVKAAQQTRTKNVETTPPEEIESIHSIPLHDTRSH